MDKETSEVLLSKVELLKEMAIDSGSPEPKYSNESYRALRLDLLKIPEIGAQLPPFIRRARNLDELYRFIVIETDAAIDVSFDDVVTTGFEDLLNSLESKITGTQIVSATHLSNLELDCRRCLQKVLGRVEFSVEEPAWNVGSGREIAYNRYKIVRCPNCESVNLLMKSEDPTTNDFSPNFVRVYPKPDLLDSKLPLSLKGKLENAIKALYAQQFESVALWCKNALEGLFSFYGVTSSIHTLLTTLTQDGILPARLLRAVEDLDAETDFLGEVHPVTITRNQAEAIIECTQEILNSVFVTA